MKKITLAAILLWSAVFIKADVLLTVDVTDPTNVIFSSTLGLASISDNTHSTYDGIVLLGFLPVGNQTIIVGGVFSNTITPSGALTSLDTLSNDGVTIPPADYSNWTGLNFYYSDSATAKPMNFVFGQTALTGSATYDLSYQPLPAVGTIGSITAGYSLSSNTPVIIGQYEVISSAIPEPATCSALAGCGMLILATVVRRRKSKT